MTRIQQSEVTIETADARLNGEAFPAGAPGIVLFAHGSGSSRFSTRNRYVAGELVRAGIGTLLFDLLTPEEEQLDAVDRSLRFDIGLLTQRLAGATRCSLARNGPSHSGLVTLGRAPARQLLSVLKEPYIPIQN